MLKSIFSVYDVKAKTFSTPFFSVNRQTALRDFHRATNDPQSDLHNFPEDYTLHDLGTFDDQSGSIACHPMPENLGMALQFKGV